MPPTKKKSQTDEINADIISMATLIEELNERIYKLEVKGEANEKLANITTNTINYILASLYVYETYFTDMGLDAEDLRHEIDTVFYEAFNKRGKTTDVKSIEYNKAVIKKVNDKVREFQERLNDIK